MKKKKSLGLFLSGVLLGMLLVNGLWLALEKRKVRFRLKKEFLAFLHGWVPKMHLSHGKKKAADPAEAPYDWEEDEDDDGQWAPPEESVYWAPSGLTYHTRPDCGALSRSKDIQSGSLTKAKSDKARTLCHLCDKPQNKKISV